MSVTKPIILDETAQRIEDRLREIKNAIVRGERGGHTCYGFYIDGSISNPASNVTYVADAAGMTPAHMDYTADKFNWGSWKDAFFMPKPCMLKSDGTVAYYLDESDYTKKADGTASDIANTAFDGNAMMEWGQNDKKIWTKIVPDADHKGATIYIADNQEDEDFHDWCFINHYGAEVDHFYTPIYNGSLISNKLRSLSGQDLIKSKTAQQERDYAKANNPSGIYMWETEIFSDIQLINFLLVLMGKSTNTQLTFGAGYTDGGSEDTIGQTGTLNGKGMFYGTSASNANGVKVFGMENWWGKQWRRYLGHVMVNGVQKCKLAKGKADGTTVDDYNLTGNGYLASAGDSPSGSSGGYRSEEYYDENGQFPSVASGSSTTFLCDGLWFNNTITAVPARGGRCNIGAACGAFCVYLFHVAGAAYWHIGASLSCKPLRTKG